MYTKNQPIYLCCDIGGVLIDNKFSEVMAEFAAKFQLKSSVISKAFAYMHKNDYSIKNKDHILDELNIDKNVWNKLIKQLWGTERLNIGLYNELIYLKNTFNAKIILTTDNTSQIEGILKKHNLEDLFDDRVVSYSVNMLKSTVGFWNFTIDFLKSKHNASHRSQIVVIDDQIAVLEAAKQAELYAISYKRHLEIIPILNKHFVFQ